MKTRQGSVGAVGKDRKRRSARKGSCNRERRACAMDLLGIRIFGRAGSPACGWPGNRRWEGAVDGGAGSKMNMGPVTNSTNRGRRKLQSSFDVYKRTRVNLSLSLPSLFIPLPNAPSHYQHVSISYARLPRFQPLLGERRNNIGHRRPGLHRRRRRHQAVGGIQHTDKIRTKGLPAVSRTSPASISPVVVNI